MDDPSELHCTVLVVLKGRFDERKPVDVTNIGFAATSQHVEAANALLELLTDPACHLLLLGVQVDGVANFFARLLVTLHFTID